MTVLLEKVPFSVLRVPLLPLLNTPVNNIGSESECSTSRRICNSMGSSSTRQDARSNPESGVFVLPKLSRYMIMINGNTHSR
jgi:hypothetical protein